MRTPRVLMFMLAALLGAASMHVAWSATMAWLLSSRYSQRMVDVRRWPHDVQISKSAEMVSMYLTHNAVPAPAPTTVFFGSSVAYGYPWPEDVTFVARYAAMRPSEHVFNASVLGADLAFIESAILCGATNAGLMADTAIVELQVVLSMASLARGMYGNAAPAEPCDETIGRVEHWSFVMRHPLGAGWLPFIWDDKASPRPDRGLAGPSIHAGFLLSRTEYARLGLAPKLQAQVVAALTRAKTIARRVYAFPPPLYVSGLPNARYEVESVHGQQAAVLAACRSVPGVHCLDPEKFYTKGELYWDLTHLNQHGQQVFAEWLAERIP
jgi:hypothetical protein